MHIPLLPHLPRGSPPDPSLPSSRHSSSPESPPLFGTPSLEHPLSNLLNFLSQWTRTHLHPLCDSPECPGHLSLRSKLTLPKRDMDSMQSRDITIGVIVGVVLLLFLGGLFFFLYRYHGSIRLTKKRRQRRYGSRSGGSSKGSHSTFSGGSDPPPPPPLA